MDTRQDLSTIPLCHHKSIRGGTKTSAIDAGILHLLKQSTEFIFGEQLKLPFRDDFISLYGT